MPPLAWLPFWETAIFACRGENWGFLQQGKGVFLIQTDCLSCHCEPVAHRRGNPQYPFGGADSHSRFAPSE